ncbi:MAG: hypothetical protein ACTSUE_23945 [Promethearchaeota archaeon]
MVKQERSEKGPESGKNIFGSRNGSMRDSMRDSMGDSKVDFGHMVPFFMGGRVALSFNGNEYNLKELKIKMKSSYLNSKDKEIDNPDEYTTRDA